MNSETVGKVDRAWMIALVIAATLAFAALASPAPASAATFNVDQFESDGGDVTPGDGTCETTGGGCTLRAAVQEAGALAGADVVQLPDGSTTSLTQPGTPNSSFPSLWVNGPLTIRSTGPGMANITGACGCPSIGSESGSVTFEGINFDGGVLGLSVNGAEVEINGSRFANHVNSGGSSAAIHVGSTSGQGVRVFDTVIENNSAAFYGATMVAHGSIAFNRTLIRNNRSTFNGGTTAAVATYSFSTPSSTIRIYNSTLENNGGGALGSVHSTIGTVDIRHSTFTGDDGAAAVRLEGLGGALTATVRGSIIAPGTGGSACSLSGPQILDLTSSFNVIGDTSCTAMTDGFNDNQTGVPAPQIGLLPIADRGGRTPVAGLAAESVAIDAGGDCVPQLSPAVDQRGRPRTEGPACDVGAFEFRTGPAVAIVAAQFSPGWNTTPRYYFEKEVGEGPVTGFECRIHPVSQPTDFASCGSPYTGYLDGPDGDYIFEVRALDSEGIAGDNSTSVTYVFDTTPPVTTVDYPLPTWRSGGILPDFTFSTTGGAIVTNCRIDAGEWEPCSSPWSPPTDLPNGHHTIELRSVDAAGNHEAALVFDMNVDREARVGLGPKKPKVSKKGKAKLIISCPETEGNSCFVQPLTVTTAGKVATKKGGKKKVLRVAGVKGTIQIAAGSTRTVNLKLSSKARKALKLKGKLKVKVTLTAHDFFDNSQNHAFTLTLRA